MDPSVFSADILDQQLRLWTRLAVALEQAQTALLSGDIVRFEQHTAEQCLCCERLVANGRVTVARSVGAMGKSECARLTNIEQTQKEVQRLARVHAGLLQRAGRSLVILRNLITRNGIAYTTSPSLQTEGPFGGMKG